jgi:hypothetical protein
LIVVGPGSTIATTGALVSTLVAAGLAADPAFAEAAANGTAYANEDRYPLRVPPGLYLGPLPLARAAIVGGFVAGPLLLAAGHVAWGSLALAVGVPLGILAARALHRLSSRWLVLVPAGIVVVDRMTLSDNVLFPREHVRNIRGVRADVSADDALDLRLGASLGSALLVLNDDAELTRAARPRKSNELVRVRSLLVAVAHREDMLAAAARRRLQVEAVNSQT